MPRTGTSDYRLLLFLADEIYVEIDHFGDEIASCSVHFEMTSRALAPISCPHPLGLGRCAFLSWFDKIMENISKIFLKSSTGTIHFSYSLKSSVPVELFSKFSKIKFGNLEIFDQSRGK
jgi:hypothetical protein